MNIIGPINYRPMDVLNIYRSIDMNRFRHVLYPEIWHFKYTDKTNRLFNNHRYD